MLGIGWRHGYGDGQSEGVGWRAWDVCVCGGGIWIE